MSNIICIDLAQHPSPIYHLEEEGSWRFLENLTDELNSETKELLRAAEYSLALIPGNGFLSTRIRLPFSDKKQISQILSSELEDIVPADLETFHPVILSILPESGSDTTGVVHYNVEIQLCPIEEIRNVLQRLKFHGIDPAYLITPANAVGTLLPVEPGDGVILVRHADTSYIRTVGSDGSIGTQRIISKPRTALDVEREGLIHATRMLSEVQSAAGERILFTWGTSDGLIPGDLAYQHVDLTTGNPLAVQVAKFLSESGRAAGRIENLRTGEFSYSLRLSEIALGLRGIGPYIYALLLCMALAFSAIFFIQKQSLSDIQAVVHQKVRETVGGTVAVGQELSAVKARNSILEQELAQIGNPNRRSPLDLWLEVTRDVPNIPGVEFKAVRVRGNQVTLEGVSPDYSARDRIEKALRAKRKTICSVRQDAAGTTSQRDGGRQFVFNIVFCE